MKWISLERGFRQYLILERSLLPASVEAYGRDIAQWFRFLEAQAPKARIDTLTRHEHLLPFVYALAETGISARTQARMISSLRAFFDYLREERLIGHNPAEDLEAPRLSRKLPTVLSVEEVERMLVAVDRSTREGERNYTMLELLYGSGLRVSELLGLGDRHLLPDLRMLRIIGKGQKERWVPVGEHAWEQLERYRKGVLPHFPDTKEGRGYWFLNRRGRPLTRVMVFTIVKQLAMAASIPARVSPHTFRHSFATHLIEGGADLRVVQELLGHSSIITTEIYTHLDTSYLQSVVKEYHPWSKK